MGTHHDLERMAEEVIAAIVLGEHGATALARRFGVSAQAVHQFRARHADEIAAALAAAAAELREQWVAVKAERIEAMAANLALIDERLSAVTAAMAAATGEEPAAPPSNEDMLALIREHRALLRAVAEELGQIPNKVTAAIDVTGYDHRPVLDVQALIADDESLPVEHRQRLLASLSQALRGRS